jgi:MFS family permease
VASYALALIGLFNVFGTYIAGSAGPAHGQAQDPGVHLLARAVAIAVFLVVPLTPLSVYVFASVMGLLWLSTVPPTNATVAQIFGVAHLSMLGGFVFFSHQIGSFMGVWLGGYLYDRTGSYDVVWYIAIALGIFAALVNLPVKEAPFSAGWRCLPCTRSRISGHTGRPTLGLFLTSHENLSIVITGASDGIGAEIARQLAARHKQDAALVLAARNEAALEAVATQCRGRGRAGAGGAHRCVGRRPVPRADCGRRRAALAASTR